MAPSTDALASTFKLASHADPLAAFRAEFVIPTNRQMKARAVAPELVDVPCTYLCGNSLGVLPRRARQLVEEELDVWATRGVEGHFDHPYDRDWVHIADGAIPAFAELVGAKELEVACMGTLTANLNLLMNTFYRPTEERYKILCEARAFPSDQYAMASQVIAHGLDPASAIIEIAPRPGEHTIRTVDILDTIKREGASIALVLFSGIQYYTGQLFAMQKITRAAKEQGCVCGWDLAHTIGNVPLSLHDWDVDFAAWCTYKYLNAGPGAIAGLFVHERWADVPIRAAGWWGHDVSTRFAMPPTFARIRGAQGFQQSNPSVLATAALLGSLQVFRAAGGMGAIRSRSLRLTGYLEALLQRSRFWVPVEEAASFGAESGESKVGVTIITPTDPEQRGAQLSLVFLPTGQGVMPRVLAGLSDRGVVGDSRKPDVIRLAPCALYNSWEDVERAVNVLEEVLGLVEREEL
ncbi:kynureninase [Laetiporus sulphureus 93-53]|uniref:Kynureninase n=1 Tax=Laetiporus sulphureus 93-53 TaxID=1314785 RepID=A0A165H4P7_9APHY|nr:kynureninase [Laetiporus sulphureus 93-53]KZT11241.1 kynureninase [Laetiporus sulphureus 93-53]